MNFLKNKFLLIISLGFLILSASVYGYNVDHLARLKECTNQFTMEREITTCDLRNTDLSGTNRLRTGTASILLHSVSKFDFTGANIQNSLLWANSQYPMTLDFTDSDLGDAELVIAMDPNKLTIDFSNSNIRGTHIRPYEIVDEGEDISGLSVTWTGAKYDKDTIFPYPSFNPKEHGMVYCYFGYLCF